MTTLTPDQRDKIDSYLEQQGLSFAPLRNEMADHMACDLEMRIAGGESFEVAWQHLTSGIGDNHFQHIQSEIMETINKRFTWSQGFTFLALALLFLSTVFKVLHLQFADGLLLASFAAVAASLMATSLSGVLLNQGKRGASRVISIVAGIILMLVGYAFKFLHWVGADQIILVSFIVLIVSLVVNALYVYRNSGGLDNLTTYLHEKYTPSIERFFLILLLPMVAWKVILILNGVTKPFVGNLILLIVMFGAGLQLLALCWRTMETNASKRTPMLLGATIVASACLMLPFLGPLLPFEIRVAIIVLFSASSAWLAYAMQDAGKGVVSLAMACLVPVIFGGWALIHLGLIDHSNHSIFFNLPVLIVLLIGLLLIPKHGIMRAFMIISLSSYVFEYMMN